MEQNVTKFDMRDLMRELGERRGQHLTGNEIIERYLKELNCENTVLQYRRSIYYFFNWRYGRETENNLTSDELVIDPYDAEDYYYECKDKWDNGEMKTSTFNNRIKGVRCFYQWLVHHTSSNRDGFRMFTCNPFEQLKTKRENDAFGARPLTEVDILKMLENPCGESEHLQERNNLILELGVTTGIRCDALVTIKPMNVIEFEGNKVIWTIDKGRTPTRKGINPYYDRLMKWYETDLRYRANDNGTIFNLHPDSANRIIREWAKSVGINKRISFHSLRTTGIIEVFNKTGSMEKAQRFANHENMATTKLYVDKADLINHDAEYIIEEMKTKGISHLFYALQTMEKEQLIKLMMIMEDDVKMRLANKLTDLIK